MKIGSHVSNRGDLMLEGAVLEAISYNANCFMIYLGAPQNSYRKPLEELRIKEAQKLAKENNINFKDTVVHAPYIINLANPEAAKRRFAIDFLIKEIKGVEAIGAKYFVFHPGNRLKQSTEKARTNIANSLREILEATKDTNVLLLVETMAGKGTEYGSTFQELGDLIKEVNNPRLNVCFDTCHTFDSGYDIVNDYEGVLAEFDNLIGLNRLQVLHINDSKNELGSRKDRHENIGYGKIGFNALHRIVTDERFANRVKILETPYYEVDNKSLAPYREEIAMLRLGKFIDFKRE